MRKLSLFMLMAVGLLISGNVVADVQEYTYVKETNTIHFQWNSETKTLTLTGEGDGSMTQAALVAAKNNSGFTDFWKNSYGTIEIYANTLIIGKGIKKISGYQSGSSFATNQAKCSKLTTVEFAEDCEMTTIPEYFMSGCSKVSSIILPKNCTSIGKYAFKNTGFTSFTFPASITSIGEEAFMQCTNLTEINWEGNPSSLEIGKSAFSQCPIKEVVLPEGVTSIGRQAFALNASLERIYIPASVTKVHPNAFEKQRFGDYIEAHKAEALVSIKVNENNANFTSRDKEGNEINALITKTTCSWSISGDKDWDIVECVPGLLIAGCCNTVIPADGTVTQIYNSAFTSAYSLTNVIIPKEVTNIGYYAFAFCSRLKSAEIHSRTIGFIDVTGSGASYFTSKGETFRGDNAKGTENMFVSDLEKLILGKEVQTIHTKSFQCLPNLKYVYLNWEDPVGYEATLFDGQYSIPTPKDVTVYVPSGTADKYAVLDPWKTMVANHNWQIVELGEIWQKSDAWDDKKVPTAEDNKDVEKPIVVVSDVNNGIANVNNLTIREGGKVTVQPGAQLRVHGVVTIENGAEADAVIVESSTINGNGTLLLKPKGDGSLETVKNAEVRLQTLSKHNKSTDIYTWQQIGVPFANPTITVEDQPQGTTFYHYAWDRYDGWFDNWSKEGSYGLATPFKGYDITNTSNNGGMTYVFSGTLTGEEKHEWQLGEGFNFCANSYTAPIFIKEFFEDINDENFNKTIYIFDGKKGDYANYITVSQADFEYSTPKTTVIPSLQGFFVHVENGKSATATLDYSKSIWNPQISNTQSEKNHIMFAPAMQNEISRRVNFILSAEHASDELTMIASDKFSSNFEGGYDVVKLTRDNIAAIYSTSALGKLSSVFDNTLDGKTLGVIAGQDEKYTLSFENVIGEDLYLIDLTNGVETFIEEGASYTFLAEPNSNEAQRFMLVSANKVPTAVEFVNNHTKVQGVYSILGQYLGDTKDLSNMSKGIYVVNGELIIK